MNLIKKRLNPKWKLLLVLVFILAAVVLLGAWYYSIPPFDNRRLILPAAYDPAWSPDGTEIAFLSSRPGESREIYSIRVDGSRLRRLTDLEENILEFVWSPSGEKIAFTSHATNKYFHVYQMNFDGSDLIQIDGLVDETMIRVLERLYYRGTWIPVFPTWETTGSLGESKLDVTINIVVPEKLSGTIPEKYGIQPECIKIAPGEDRVAFISGDDKGLYILEVSEDKLTKLDIVKPLVCDCLFVWSPDGYQLALVSLQDDQVVLDYYDFNTGQITNLTKLNQTIDLIEWSPSGEKLVYTYQEFDQQILTILDVNSKSQETISVKGNIVQMDWSPDGSKLAYVSRVEVLSFDYAHMIYVVDVEEGRQANCLTCRLRLFLNIRLGYYKF